jgi:hypothetical protein
MGGKDETKPAQESIDAAAFLKDEALIAFFAKQRGLSLDDARARLREILEGIDKPEP